MATRVPVKKRLLTRQETLQRLRDECSERISRDKEAFKHELRGSINKAIRESISAGDDWFFEIDESDIDRLVDEFIRDGEFDEPEEVIEEAWKPGMIKCPICPGGWLLEPFPGTVTCDGCPNMSLGVGRMEVASALDSAIRQHSLVCPASLRFTSNDNILYSVCASCALYRQLVP